MKYVLDTNTVLFLMRGDSEVSSRLIAHQRKDVSLPQPVVAEIEYGLARMPRSARRARLRRRFDILLADLTRAEWTDDVSKAFGLIKAELEKRGERIEDFDVAVASHAVSRDAVLVTDNIEHMSRVPRLRLENWTEPAS
jgi:tRNA(fMet)-specific endonuclease VapC